MRPLRLPNRLGQISTVRKWQQMGQLCAAHGAVNLTVGSPPFLPPKFLRDQMVNAMNEGFNTYFPTQGMPVLREGIAKRYSPFLNQSLRPSNTLVTVGAQEALALTCLTFAGPGDQILTMQPFFGEYDSCFALSGATIKCAPWIVGLNEETGQKQWKLDYDAIRKQLSDKTKLFCINSPHNPTGRVLSRKELEELSKILEQYPHVWVLSDQIYDFLTFGKEHVYFASLGDNWKKTITIFSGGKLFAATGWKIGWVVAQEDLITEMSRLHNPLGFCFNSTGQVAMGRGLAKVDEPYEGFNSYPEWMQNLFSTTHDRLVDLVNNSKLATEYGMEVIKGEGGYVLVAQIGKLRPLVPQKYFTNEFGADPKIECVQFQDGKVPLDYAVCRWLLMEKGFTFLPMTFMSWTKSPYYRDNFVRLPFCFEPERLDPFEKVLQKL